MTSHRTMHLTVVLVAASVLVSAGLAAAQGWGGRDTGGTAVSYCYSGDEQGFRLEFGRERYVYDGGWFSDGDDGDIYCLELGVSASDQVSDYGGIPFVLGLGAYRWQPADPELDDTDDIAIWAGAGDFDHAKKGLYYQYRYIFSGPLSGSQGIIGWAF